MAKNGGLQLATRCDVRHASARHKLLLEQFSTEQESRYALGFRRCGMWTVRSSEGMLWVSSAFFISVVAKPPGDGCIKWGAPWFGRDRLSGRIEIDEAYGWLWKECLWPSTEKKAIVVMPYNSNEDLSPQSRKTPVVVQLRSSISFQRSVLVQGVADELNRKVSDNNLYIG